MKRIFKKCMKKIPRPCPRIEKRVENEVEVDSRKNLPFVNKDQKSFFFS